ncbi:MAG: SDR family NAD(P)-dependent oxidoreductase [Myxococcota bacterium]
MTQPGALERGLGAGRRALVTGASSGIGEAFARRLAREGYDLTLVARRRAELERLAETIGKRHVAAVDILVADLTQDADLLAVEERLATDEQLALLVNNAGTGTVGAFAEIEAQRVDADVRLNVLALTRLARAALPGMIARGSGALIQVSSMAAFSAGPWQATYPATKAYVNRLTLALHEELRGSGVRVQALCPGFTRTAFQAHAGVEASRVPEWLWMEPDEVVDASLRALGEGRAICIPGRLNRLLAVLQRGLPERLVARVSGALTRAR